MKRSRPGSLRQFLPRDRTFWLYHCTALAAWSVIQGTATYLNQTHTALNITASLLWIPFYTFGVLCFRFHYRKYRWRRFTTTTLIGITLLYSLAVGVFVTSALMSITLPLYWDSVFEADTGAGLSNPDLPVRIAVLNIALTQLYAGLWAFIYIYVTSSRHTREIELKNLRLKNRLQDAQLSSLSRQLNPHFLFNSLNNIRFMIHENPAQADKTITALSEILRYSLQRGRDDKVTVGEELAVVKRYVEVIHAQFEDRLDFRLSAGENLDSCLIPPMILQLLVENAVKHGVENSRDTATLSVDIHSAGASLQLTVSNPVAPGHETPVRGTGTGLRNIEDRLHLLYGRSAGLRVRRGDNRFTVEVTIPRQTGS